MWAGVLREGKNMSLLTEADLRKVAERKRAELGLAAVGVEVADSTPPVFLCRECGKPLELEPGILRACLRGWPRGNNLWPCPACKAAEEERIRQENERRRQEALAAQERARQAALEAVRADLPGTLARIGVPPHWCRASLEACLDLPPELVEAARQWAGNPQGLLYLCGYPGAGKSYLAVGIVRHVLEAGTLPPEQCCYLDERGFLDELRASYDGEHGQWPPRLSSAGHGWGAGLVLFDDLGSSRLTGWGKGEIAGKIEHRHGLDLPTIITSNLGLDALAGQVDARIASRVAEWRQVYEFPSRDLRVTGAARPSREQGKKICENRPLSVDT
jgi:DNA replication protein DnaC